jgi:hypothetical protein
VQLTVIVELEFLEQILGDEWPLARSISFIASHGKDGWAVLRRHWEDRNVLLISVDGMELPGWRVREIITMKNAEELAFVRCTEKGAGLV